MADFVSALAAVEAGKDLSESTTAALVGELLAGNIAAGSPDFELVRRLLVALAEKGETAAELVGAATAMRQHMTPIRVLPPANRASTAVASDVPAAIVSQAARGEQTCCEDCLLDTCGTGGSRSGTFNISTAAAIVVSAAGVPVAKHGNRKATSRSGSADVLAELGVQIESDRGVVEQSLRELRLCFCFAPRLHPAMRHVAAIRKAIASPTMFNLLGPLCNPAGATHQLLGTGREAKQQVLAAALQSLGTRRSVVVRGGDGQDEVSLDGVTTAIEVDGTGQLTTHQWTAETFGLEPAGVEALQAVDPQHSARIIRAIFAGTPGPCRDTVVANAAVAFWLVGRTGDLLAGAQLAAQTIDSRAAERQLEKFAHFTQQHQEGG